MFAIFKVSRLKRDLQLSRAFEIAINGKRFHLGNILHADFRQSFSFPLSEMRNCQSMRMINRVAYNTGVSPAGTITCYRTFNNHYMSTGFQLF